MMNHLTTALSLVLLATGCAVPSYGYDSPSPDPDPVSPIHVGVAPSPTYTGGQDQTDPGQAVPATTCDSARFQACDDLYARCQPSGDWSDCYAFKLCYQAAYGDKGAVEACVTDHPNGSQWWSAIVACDCTCQWDPPGLACGGQWGAPVEG